MKHIRTKEGIFEVCKEIENGYNINTKPFLETTKTRYYLNPFISKEKVIKQADTIEELCDEFYLVVYDALAKKKVRISFENCNSAKTHCNRYFKNFDWSIYGAIWTDKGLIYVAKMNDKGELELL